MNGVPEMLVFAILVPGQNACINASLALTLIWNLVLLGTSLLANWTVNGNAHFKSLQTSGTVWVDPHLSRSRTAQIGADWLISDPNPSTILMDWREIQVQTMLGPVPVNFIIKFSVGYPEGKGYSLSKIRHQMPVARWGRVHFSCLPGE